MNVNEVYSIVKPARIVGIFGQNTLMTSVGIHAIFLVMITPDDYELHGRVYLFMVPIYQWNDRVDIRWLLVRVSKLAVQKIPWV
jgi:hypothetical protein